MVNRKLLIVNCLIVGLLVFSGCNLAPAPEAKKSYVIADSKAYEASIFRQRCAICHGAEANGKTMNAVEIPSLRYGKAAQLTEDEIYNQIANGKLPMPPFKGQLTDDEIRKMVKFIKRDLQQRPD